VFVVRPSGQSLSMPNDPFPIESFDLSVITADAAGGAPTERPLATNVIPGPGSPDPCPPGTAICFPSDAQGRVFVTTGYDSAMGIPIVARIDPLTGARLELGVTPFVLLSPSTKRMVIRANLNQSEATLYEADDSQVPLGLTTTSYFIGEDLYQLTADGALVRIVPGGAPEILATGISYFLQATASGDLLLALTRPTADPAVTALSYLDTVTLVETPSPFGNLSLHGGLTGLSPDGRWFFQLDDAANTATFIERATGAVDVFAPSDFMISYANQGWRPGHDELWFEISQYPQAIVAIKTPGGSAVEFQATAWTYSDDRTQTGWFFSRDGAYWFSSRAPVGDPAIIQVGSADDPMAPRYDVAPAGTSTDFYWRLADGRILVPAYLKDPDRSDLYALDPRTGESRPLGEEGFVMAVGQTRVLASQHVNDSRGDLTAIELGTARATVLAQEFTTSAVVEPVGGDVVAPGAHIAYQFQARFESPWDGIWLATVP